MKRIGVIVAFVVVGMLGSQPAWAARTQVHVNAESQDYGRKFGGMIGRGVLNVATCFVDVIVDVVNGTKSGPPLVGTLTGVAKGAGCGVLRAGSGAVDLVTFWVPGFNGFPVSDSYEDCFATGNSSVSVRELPPTQSEPESMMTSPIAGSTPPQEVSTPAQPAPTPVHHRKRAWKK